VTLIFKEKNMECSFTNKFPSVLVALCFSFLDLTTYYKSKRICKKLHQILHFSDLSQKLLAEVLPPTRIRQIYLYNKTQLPAQRICELRVNKNYIFMKTEPDQISQYSRTDLSFRKNLADPGSQIWQWELNDIYLVVEFNLVYVIYEIETGLPVYAKQYSSSRPFMMTNEMFYTLVDDNSIHAYCFKSGKEIKYSFPGKFNCRGVRNYPDSVSITFYDEILYVSTSKHQIGEVELESYVLDKNNLWKTYRKQIKFTNTLISRRYRIRMISNVCILFLLNNGGVIIKSLTEPTVFHHQINEILSIPLFNVDYDDHYQLFFVCPKRQCRYLGIASLG
jgi:hypothetical protein